MYSSKTTSLDESQHECFFDIQSVCRDNGAGLIGPLVLTMGQLYLEGIQGEITTRLNELVFKKRNVIIFVPELFGRDKINNSNCIWVDIQRGKPI